MAMIHPWRFMRQVMRLWGKEQEIGELVTQSYDRVSGGYDAAWTHHMRGLTERLMGKLRLKGVRRGVDLTTGTGYGASLLAEGGVADVVGVDRSEGMLGQAREHYGQRCRFVQSDILEWLRGQEAESVDVITCCWGLGYSHPREVVKECGRVLRSGGRLAVIDNSLFSLREVMGASIRAFLERPEALAHVMRFRFMAGKGVLGRYMRRSGLRVEELWSGQQCYVVGSGAEAVERLRKTGAAAGFEYACRAEDEKAVFGRFAELLERRYAKQEGIVITHRYLAGIGVKG